MKILLLGGNGQVGWELRRALAPLGTLVAPLRRNDSGLPSDLAQPDSLRETVRRIAPDVIVNAAAYTAVDRAESEPVLAHTVNATAPGVLAQEAAARGAWLVHYSTDYVFDGSGIAPWREEAPTGPLNVYGASKLAGEAAIRASGCNHLVLRTSWVYAARGNNFARTMLRLAHERDTLQVVVDQVGAPTGADLIADVSAHALRVAIARPALGGVYHLAAAGETSWHGYACRLLIAAAANGAALKASPDTVRPVPSSAWPTPARRPANSRLDATRLCTAFGLQMPPWEEGVERVVAELLDGATIAP